MDQTSVFTVPEELEEERFDAVVASLSEGQSRSYLKNLIKDGSVLLNGKTAKPSTKVHENDVVTLVLPEKIVPDILPENIPLDILYEDDDVLVVNKPKGMVVHPAPGHYSGTLVNAVMYHCGDSLSGINGVMRPGIVHRIDRDTTGSVIICKNDAAHNSIAQQLQEHTIVRRYFAILYDNIAEDEFTVDQPLGRDARDRKKMAVRSDGKRAVTHCKVLRRFGAYTYVECRLETGRTHQIRVHMAYVHHPLLGDEVYAGRRKSPFVTQGQCLHAGILGFIHPRTGEYIETSAPLPEYFEAILGKLDNL
ncbi:MAG: RluA family pseudouridine synthase [Lachnospiraceae bacterium]|nr:RluA family pseudouridine synthase [Lachnospiraceae bacterium]